MTKTQRKNWRGPALTGLFVLALFYTLYLARAFFLPVTLAIMFSLVLRPLVRGLAHWHIPSGLGAALVLLVVLGALGYALAAVYQPAIDWVSRAPDSLRQVEHKIRQLRRPVDEMGRAAEQMERMTDPEPKRAPEVELKKPRLRDTLISGAQRLFSGAVVTVFLLYFLLATGGRLLARITALVTRVGDGAEGAAIVKETEHQISRYLVTITLINAGEGVAVGLTTWAIGIPNPLLWGVMAACLNFIPYLGGAVGVTVLAVVALLTFDDVRWALLAPASYAVISGLEGMVVTPVILGRRFALNPVVVFVWLIFWGWLWGMAGALLAMPMLTILKIISERVPALQPVERLIGRD